MATETPAFELVRKDGDVELRRYAPRLVAAVTVTAPDMDTASTRGFRALANFIFGNNSGDARVAMTAPVEVQPAAKRSGAQIAMTAPVEMEPAGDAWIVRFTMPSSYTRATLPKPRNADVRIEEIPGELIAVAKFSWFTGEDSVVKHRAALEQWLKAEGLRATAAWKLTRYDPPWTLPFLRTNEIWIPIDDAPRAVAASAR